jgi:hypothetical protein
MRSPSEYTKAPPAGLGLVGREDSWNYENDTRWFFTHSANEVVFACGENHPTLSFKRALGMMIEGVGAEMLIEQLRRFDGLTHD